MTRHRQTDDWAQWIGDAGHLVVYPTPPESINLQRPDDRITVHFSHRAGFDSMDINLSPGDARALAAWLTELADRAEGTP